MNVTATGTSSLTSLYLQQLLGTSSTSSSSSTASGTSSASDLLTLSAAGQQASGAQGTDPFQTDLTNLQNTIASGDLSSAKTAYAAMLAKMQQNGAVPSDFSAIGTALDAGDLTTAASAVTKVQKDTASGSQGAQGSNPLQNDMNTLGNLIQSGDLTDAQTLFSSILSKLSGTTAAATSSTAAASTTTASATTAASATTSSASTSSSGSSSSDALTTSASALETALEAGDSTSSATAFEALLAQLQAQGPPPHPLAKSMESVASAAYLSSANAVATS
jgi:hypothetical protein